MRSIVRGVLLVLALVVGLLAVLWPTAAIGQVCSVKGVGRLPGTLSGSYRYWGNSLGNNFNEFTVSYDHSIPLNRTASVDFYGLGQFNQFSESPAPVGSITQTFRLGGGVNWDVGTDFSVGVTGGYDTNKGQETQHSGGRLAAYSLSGVGRTGIMSLSLAYYLESAAELSLYRRSPTGYEVTGTYFHDLFAHGLRFIATASGYGFDIGTKYSGWRVGGEVVSSSGLFNLTIDVGRDGYNGTYYTVGAGVNWPI